MLSLLFYRLSYNGILLGSHILVQVGNNIAFGLEGRRAPGGSRRGLRPQAGGMIHKIGIKSTFFDFLHCQIPGELMDNGADHLDMGEFFRT